MQPDIATLIKLRKKAHNCQFRAIERKESKSLVSFFEGKVEAYSKLLEILLESASAPAPSESSDAPPPRPHERAHGSTRLHIGLGEHSEAVMDIHVAEDGLGGIDQPTKREPSISELNVIIQAMLNGRYKIHSTLI